MKMHKHLKEKRERLKGWNLDFLMKDLSRNEIEKWVEIIQSKVEDEYYKGIKHKKINKNMDCSLYFYRYSLQLFLHI